MILQTQEPLELLAYRLSCDQLSLELLHSFSAGATNQEKNMRLVSN